MFVQGSDGTAETLFGWLAAGTALVFFLGVAGAVVFSLGAGFDAEVDDADAPIDPFDGLTLEWQVPSPAVGGERTALIPEIASPYPLLDAKEGA